MATATQSIAAIAEENSAATEQVLASSEEMGAQADAVTAQAEDLARTAAQLQELVLRFHAEVGTDAAIEAAYADDDEGDADVPRRRGGGWDQAEVGHGYVSRAS